MSDFDDILDEAEAQTNKQLADKIAALTKLAPQDIETLAPSATDKLKLTQLIEIVRSAADANDKKAQILANIESYAGIILNIAGKVLL